MIAQAAKIKSTRTVCHHAAIRVIGSRNVAAGTVCGGLSCSGAGLSKLASEFLVCRRRLTHPRHFCLLFAVRDFKLPSRDWVEA